MKLTNVSRVARAGVKVVIALIILYYIFTGVLIPAGRNVYSKIFPPKDLPHPIFGQLDALEFVNKQVLNPNPIYQLNTKTGTLPSNLPNRMTVYKFKTPQFSYEFGKAAQQDATYLGYTDENLVSDVKGNIYRWQNQESGSFLQIKTDTKELVAKTIFVGKAEFFAPASISQSSAISIAKNMFSAIDRFSDPLYVSGTQTVYLGKFTPTGIVETRLLEEAQIAKVDFFRYMERSSTNRGYPIYSPDSKKGLLEAYVRKLSNDKPTLNYPSIEAYYRELDPFSDATYPIITVKEAWDAVSHDKGVISNVTPKNDDHFSEYIPTRVDRILVNDVYLAYYETPKFQKYLQPIYVFEGNYTTTGGGDGTITLYFPAIQGQYIKQTQPSQTPQTQK